MVVGSRVMAGWLAGDEQTERPFFWADCKIARCRAAERGSHLIIATLARFTVASRSRLAYLRPSQLLEAGLTLFGRFGHHRVVLIIMEGYLIRAIAQLAGGGEGSEPGKIAASDSNNNNADSKSKPPMSFLDAYDLGRLSCVSKAVSKRCGDDDIVGGVMRSQWPDTAKLDPSVLLAAPASAAFANDDEEKRPGTTTLIAGKKKEEECGEKGAESKSISCPLWLFRQMAGRLILEQDKNNDDEFVGA